MKNRTLNCQLFFSKTNDFLSYYLPCQAARSIHTIETYRDGLTVFRRYITNVRKISIKKFLFTDCTSELMLDYLGYLKRLTAIYERENRGGDRDGSAVCSQDEGV